MSDTGAAPAAAVTVELAAPPQQWTTDRPPSCGPIERTTSRGCARIERVRPDGSGRTSTQSPARPGHGGEAPVGLLARARDPVPARRPPRSSVLHHAARREPTKQAYRQVLNQPDGLLITQPTRRATSIGAPMPRRYRRGGGGGSAIGMARGAGRRRFRCPGWPRYRSRRPRYRARRWRVRPASLIGRLLG